MSSARGREREHPIPSLFAILVLFVGHFKFRSPSTRSDFYDFVFLKAADDSRFCRMSLTIRGDKQP
jgi:hypothetical protein